MEKVLNPMLPQTDERLTILPPPCEIMMGATSLMVKKLPLTLMSIISSYWVSVVSPMKLGSKMPAELIRMSMRPKAAFTSATSDLTAFTSRTSATKAWAAPPAASILSTTPCALARFEEPATATRAPLGGESQCDRLADA